MADLSRKIGASDATLYIEKKRYLAMGMLEIGKLYQLEMGDADLQEEKEILNGVSMYLSITTPAGLLDGQLLEG